jgi:hypothetical protein
MRVELGIFACSSIETHLGSDVPAAIRTALIHHAHKLATGRGPIPPPRFLPDRAPGQPQVAFDVTIDSSTEAALAREAAGQGTTLSQMAVHAVMVYLAELEFLEGSFSLRTQPQF